MYAAAKIASLFLAKSETANEVTQERLNAPVLATMAYVKDAFAIYDANSDNNWSRRESFEYH